MNGEMRKLAAWSLILLLSVPAPLFARPGSMAGAGPLGLPSGAGTPPDRCADEREAHDDAADEAEDQCEDYEDALEEVEDECEPGQEHSEDCLEAIDEASEEGSECNQAVQAAQQAYERWLACMQGGGGSRYQPGLLTA